MRCLTNTTCSFTDLFSFQQYPLNPPYEQEEGGCKKPSPYAYFPKSLPPDLYQEAPMRIMYQPTNPSSPFFYPPSLPFNDNPFHVSKATKFFSKPPSSMLTPQQQLILMHRQRQPLFIQEPIFPEFPPANFNIPDIASSNSVFGADPQEEARPPKDKIASFYACLPLPSFDTSPDTTLTGESANPTPESHEEANLEQSHFPPPNSNPQPPTPSQQPQQTTKSQVL